MTAILYCFLIGWVTCKETCIAIDQIRDRAVTVLDVSEDDFLPTLVVELAPPAATIASTPEAPVMRCFTIVTKESTRPFSPNNYS